MIFSNLFLITLGSGNIYVLKTMMFFGVDVINYRYSVGKTSLMFASGNGYSNMVSLLLKEGADINEVDTLGATALIYASEKGHSNVVSLLLDAGADIKAVINSGCTALMLASGNGHNNVASLLLEAGAAINAVDNSGFTALMFAFLGGHGNMVSLLLGAGADIKAVINSGGRALMVASGYGNSNLASLLLEAGADINEVDNNGMTALMAASDKGHRNVVSLLLKWGADINLINREEQNAFDLAKSDDCRNLIKAAQVAIKQAFSKDLSFDETSFLINKNNAALVEQYIKDYSVLILQKIFSGKELIEQDRIFTKYSSYFESLKGKLHEVSMAASDSVSTKLTQDLMSQIFQFIPIKETLEIGPNLIDYSNLKSKIDVIRINAINHQENDIASVESIEPHKQFSVGFWSGAVLGFLITPAIRCGRDKINDVNNEKTLDQYYQEALALDNLSYIVAAFVEPALTQIVYAYIGIPYIAQGYRVTEVVKQITDSPFAQGLLQVSFIEGMMLVMDGAGVLGEMAYCTAYECE